MTDVNNPISQEVEMSENIGSPTRESSKTFDGKVHREESALKGGDVEDTESSGSGFTLQGDHLDRANKLDVHKKKGKIGRQGDRVKQAIGLKKQDPKTKLCIYLMICIFLWSICGMWFYHDVEGWSWSGAMFYATNVGLGVGYGVYNITTAGSKWFTIFYCLMGSSFVAGGMGLFVGFYMEQSDDRYSQKREEFLLAGQGTKEYLGSGKYNKKQKNFFLYLKHKYTIWAIVIFVILIAAGIIFAMVGGGQLGCPAETIPAPVPALCYDRDSTEFNLYCKDPATWNGADELTISTNACWTKNCEVYSNSIDGNHCDDLAEALFFVVTSMSTASQVAPKNLPFQLWFTIVYIFIGIPIYGALLGMVADIYINRYSRKQDREDLNRSAAELDADMFDRMCAINATHKANERLLQAGENSSKDNDNDESNQAPVFWGDYLEYMLRRNELVDRKLLDLIKYNYYKLDTEQQGYFTRAEVEDQFNSNYTNFPEPGAESENMKMNEM